MYIATIGYEEARKLAEDAAEANLKLWGQLGVPYLDKFYMEGELCWFFFRNPNIDIPDHVFFKSCFCVTKKGNTSCIHDFDRDPVELEKYLKKYSEYCREKDY